MICKLSVMLAGMLEREKIIRAEDRAVYEYGFQITIANITNALIVLLIGLITHSIVRVLIFYTVFLSMRMFCGGFHAKTYTQCFCLFGTTCLLCTVAGYGVMEFTNVLSAAVISVVLQGLCLYQMAPVENENHPLSKAVSKLQYDCVCILGSDYVLDVYKQVLHDRSGYLSHAAICINTNVNSKTKAGR